MEITLMIASAVRKFEFEMTKEQKEDAKAIMSFISKPNKLNINLKRIE
jgi:hypothetical protein